MNLRREKRFLTESVFNAGDGVAVLCDPVEFAVAATTLRPAAAVDEHQQGRIFDALGKMQVEQKFDAIGFGEQDAVFFLYFVAGGNAASVGGRGTAQGDGNRHKDREKSVP